MPNTLINGALINGLDDDAGGRNGGLDLVIHTAPTLDYSFFPDAVVALEMGRPRAVNELDQVAALVVGLDLYRSDGFPVLEVGQPAPDVTLRPPSFRPMEMGKAHADAHVELTAPTQGAVLQLGGGHAVAVFRPAAAGSALEMGDSMAATAVLFAPTFRPLELGSVSVKQHAYLRGIDLVRHTPPRLVVADDELTPASYFPLELGTLGAPSVALTPRTFFPLELGSASLSREAAC